jgi:hypothetical protein
MTILFAALVALADPAAAFRALAAGGKVATVTEALDATGMPRSATVLLAALASDPAQGDSVRAAAKEALALRAAQDPVLALLLVVQQGDPGKLPPPLALAVARGHLEAALQLAPPEEGAAFAPLDQGPLEPASAEVDTRPKAALAELDRARAVAGSVPAGSPQSAEAHAVAGLAAMAAGDGKGAEKEFVAAAEVPVDRRDAAGLRRRDQAFLQLARLAYQSGDDAHALALYDQVSSGAPEWLDALFEASWAHFRRGEDERALGSLLTLNAPFFQQRFFPESFVLKALVLYRNCRYADARAALAQFEQRYRPMHDGLAEALARIPTPQDATELLARGAPALQQAVPPAAREEVALIAQAPDLGGAVEAARQLAEEIDSIDRRPEPFRNSALVAVVAPRARQARIALLAAAGRRLLSRIAQERAELRELLGQSMRLSYEIAGREKELLDSGDSGLAAGRRAPPQVTDDEELWPFQGEYWRDELGSYEYQLGRRCARRRAAPPTAQGPAATAPDQVAGH